MDSNFYYVCLDLVSSDDGYLRCSEWVKQENLRSGLFFELSSLSYNDTSVLLSLTALLFATAWVWRLLSNQAFR